jgi:hypothetical protein
MFFNFSFGMDPKSDFSSIAHKYDKYGICAKTIPQVVVGRPQSQIRDFAFFRTSAGWRFWTRLDTDRSDIVNPRGFSTMLIIET